MWPWGHLAVGYLAYSMWRRRRGERPGSPEVSWLAVGTLLPDLVDKPLAWQFGLLESGRSLGHSLVVAAVVLGVLWVVLVPRVGRGSVVALAVGSLSHPLADLPWYGEHALDPAYATYLVWPLLPPPPYETEGSFLAHLLAYAPGPYEAFQAGLLAVAGYVWYRDGAPGAGTGSRWVARRRR